MYAIILRLFRGLLDSPKNPLFDSATNGQHALALSLETSAPHGGAQRMQADKTLMKNRKPCHVPLVSSLIKS
jgi:hypothetical protein